MARRRRSNYGARPVKTLPKRTPGLLYLVLALLCLAGSFYAQQNLSKTIVGQVLDAYTGQPLAGVSLELTNDPQQARDAGIPPTGLVSTDITGKFELTQATTRYSLIIGTNNYRTILITNGLAITNEIRLTPSLLRGQVKDPTGQNISRATVSMDNRSVEASTDGNFAFSDAPISGTLKVRAPGYNRLNVDFNQTVRVNVTLDPFQTKAIYIAPPDVAGPSIFNNIMASIQPADITAVVVDVKNEAGRILFDSKLPLAATLIADESIRIPNLPNLVKTFQAKNLYSIARIITYQDPLLTDLKPDWTLKTKAGGLWKDTGGFNWINPYKREAWEHYISLAVEAAQAGFDEIQFVGLHFPVIGNLEDIEYGLPPDRPSNEASRGEAINAFLKMARTRLSRTGTYISVSVFGSALVEGGDLGIGMNLTQIAPNVDYISPLIFPSEWQPGAFGIDQPINKPYELVRQSMFSAKSLVKDRLWQIRPWIQDFKPGGGIYGETQVREQIRAIEEIQTKGNANWLMFNSNSQYSLLKKP